MHLEIKDLRVFYGKIEAIKGISVTVNQGEIVTLIGSNGAGKSTLNKWVSHYRPSDLVAAPQADLARENERLRLENRVLREEREIVKRRLSSSRAKGREVRFRA